MKIIPLSILILIIIIACNKAEINQTENEPTIVKQSLEKPVKIVENVDTTTFDSLACEAHFSKVDSLNNIKYELFVQNILTPALQNPKLTSANKDFLLALKNELQLDYKTKSSRYTIDNLLMPIFQLEDKALGIFGNENYDCQKTKKGTTKCDVLNLEHQLINNIHYTIDGEGQYFSYPEQFKNIIKNRNNEFYIFSVANRTTTIVNNFGYYYGTCLVYYHYPISTENIVQNDKVLFASKYPLDLIFEKQPKIDEQLKNDHWQCGDCVFQYEPETIFAKLQGVDNLYFTYTDTFNPKEQFDYPERALIMLIDDSTKVDLWKEDLDLFGCQCL